MRRKRDGNVRKLLGIVLLRESNSKKGKVYLSLVSTQRVDAVYMCICWSRFGGLSCVATCTCIPYAFISAVHVRITPPRHTA